MFARHLPYQIGLLLVVLIYGCAQSDQVADDSIQATAAQPTDREAAIYDFIKMLIADQELDKTNWLNPLPAEFPAARLNEMLIDSGSRQPIEVSPKLGNVQAETHFGLPQCLRQDDIFFIQKQLPGHTGFQWDHSRLGFASHQTDHWYQFSVPVFSIDSTKAIITLLSLCKGLCGHGQTLVYQKTNHQWAKLGAYGWFY